ncbi:pectinesterase [Ranunculus cassubicifolius]
MFGNGAAVFQNCQIVSRKGLPNQKNTITAHGRKDPNQSTGFSIQFCNISAASDLGSIPTYLGRPWKQYSRTVFMQSYMSSAVSPQGWLEWQGDFALSTLYYGEYMNYGPGAGLGSRVKWPGYHQMDSIVASTFTVAKFIDGNMWLPPTGVKYIAGLTM